MFLGDSCLPVYPPVEGQTGLAALEMTSPPLNIILLLHSQILNQNVTIKRLENKVKKTLVLGGSTNPGRYSNRAIRKLRSYGHPVVSIGNREGTVEDVFIETGTPEFEGIHTVTIYLGTGNQKQYHDYIIGLKPRRIIFNPGTENSELAALAGKENIEVVEYCTLILLDTNTF